MQILWKAPMSLEEYVALGKAVEFPVPEECPVCRRKVNLKRHGWYLRYAAREDLEVQVSIPRLLCPACRKTISLLPSFLIPRFQRTVGFIVKVLGKKLSCSRQVAGFYWHRFLRNINRILAFFRDLCAKLPLPKDPKLKAMKLREMVEDFPAEEFSVLFHQRFRRSFMAI